MASPNRQQRRAAERARQKAQSTQIMIIDNETGQAREATPEEEQRFANARPAEASEVKTETTADTNAKASEAAGQRAREAVGKVGGAVVKGTATALVAPVLAVAFATEALGFCTGANVAAFMRGFANGGQRYNGLRDGAKA